MSTPAQHPFLQKTLPIDWPSLKPEHIEEDISIALANAEAQVEELAQRSLEGLSFENTFLALEKATEDLNRAWSKVTHLDAVCNSKALREAYNAMLPKVAEFFAKIPLNEGLWNILKHAHSVVDHATLSPTQQRFMNETLADFRESGADLPQDQKARFQEIEAELAKLTQKFSENVLDATNAWELIISDPLQLKGLPETSIEEARQSALSKGHGQEGDPKWRFTLHAPSYIAVMTYLDDEAIRKQIWEAHASIGRTAPYDNKELIESILKLRHEKSQLLGKEHFADLTLERRMAGSGAQALTFVEDLHGRIEKAFKREGQELEAFKAEQLGTQPEALEPWEAAYWAEKQRKAKYDFDEEALRPYFAIEAVTTGLFKLTERVFNVKIRELKAHELAWHHEVTTYELLDESDTRLGIFYADWHPREPKRSGAWMDPLSTGAPHDSEHQEPHVGAICGNLSPSTEGKPALLTHREVETIFHEFGHLLHHLLGKVDVRSLSGTAVAWDFVELPSQIMENWCWERESLDLFARHYKDGKPIPEALFQKMLKARTYRAASATMRQLSFAKMDLDLHIHFHTSSERDIETYIKQSIQDYLPRYKTEPPSIIRQFSHLFANSTGYAAGYYSYKWAEVLDADAFTRFKKEGVLSRTVGIDFRDQILSRGNSEEAAQLFRNFMGRDPDLTALLVRCGLVHSA
tara:strand:+ start:764 stop:2839 length:2076 start_codon:yes stop_codon:yes gene_type:complete